jgi:Chalcone isomerase-like
MTAGQRPFLLCIGVGPGRRWRSVVGFLAALLLCAAAAFGSAPTPPSEALRYMPGAQLGGTARLSFMGFGIYQASLWVGPDFRQGNYAAHEFCLELSYLRGFSSEAIAHRSIEEMRRIGSFTPEQAAQWQALLQASFPDVKKGDRIMGMNQPGKGLLMYTNGVRTGEIADPELARLFFGIWLAPSTSEPKMRLGLLANTKP